MKYLLEVAEGVARGAGGDEARRADPAQSASVSDELLSLTKEDVSLLAEALFGAEPQIDGTFYRLLATFQHHIGYGDLHRTVVGRIWAHVLRELSEEKGLELLSLLLEDDRQGFWSAVRCLPTFCGLVELPPEFAATWFHNLGTRVAGDWAGGGFYDAVCRYAETSPGSALAIFERYLSGRLEDLTVHLAGLLLGTVRAKSIPGQSDAASVRRWDRSLQRSTSIQERLIYDKSLVSSFNLGTVSIRKLRAKLEKMLAGTPEEVSEAFDVVGRCLRKDRSDTAFIRFAFKWYRQNVSPAIPDYAKYHLVNSLWLLCSSKDVPDRTSLMARAGDLLVMIQPIPKEHHGTWQELESYLVMVLESDHTEFERVFVRLIKSNAAGMSELVRKGTLLKGELRSRDVARLVTRLLLSVDDDEWQIAKSLFSDDIVACFSDDVLAEAEERELEMALLRSVRSPFLAEGTRKYLLQLERHFQNTSPDLQNTYRDELVLQALNYPGTCLRAWQEITTKSHLMVDAIAHAERYFDNLSKIANCPARSFAFPGCDAARRKAAQGFSAKVRRQAEEHSVFAQLGRQFEIIYGDRWATFIGGRLDGPSSFSELSHQMEFPRLEVIDPEGMAMRRLQVSSRITAIEAEISKS